MKTDDIQKSKYELRKKLIIIEYDPIQADLSASINNIQDRTQITQSLRMQYNYFIKVVGDLVHHLFQPDTRKLLQQTIPTM